MSKEPTTNSQGLSEECHAMISRISHEVRNPVAVIHSFHQLLLLAHPELSNDLYFQKIQENMAFLNSLLDELSCYNHSYRAVRAYVNPYLLLQNLCADTGVLLEKQQVSIELVKESAIPRFALDTTQFRQLFLNLIRNAAEAMPSGGTIKISLCFDGPSVCRTLAAESPPRICRLSLTFLSHIRKTEPALDLPSARKL